MMHVRITCGLVFDTLFKFFFFFFFQFSNKGWDNDVAVELID